MATSSSSFKIRYFVLTGEPGVGKTTLVKKLSTHLNEKQIETNGFYTEEVRKNGVREGFDVVTLDGVRARLARDASLLNNPVRCKVGKYGVLVEEFEKTGIPAISGIRENNGILIIDEIGKMELFSSKFKNTIQEILSSNSFVLTTIPSRRSDALVENIRNHRFSKVWVSIEKSKLMEEVRGFLGSYKVITKENRNTIGEEILKCIIQEINAK